jgi:hypothetical protein
MLVAEILRKPDPSDEGLLGLLEAHIDRIVLEPHADLDELIFADHVAQTNAFQTISKAKRATSDGVFVQTASS